MSRSEFRFVIDGLELTEEQRDHIARAIQEAGARAASGIVKGPTLALDVGRFKELPEWIGRILLVQERAVEVAEGLHNMPNPPLLGAINRAAEG